LTTDAFSNLADTGGPLFGLVKFMSCTGRFDGSYNFPIFASFKGTVRTTKLWRERKKEK